MSNNIIQINQDIIHTELKDLVRTSVEEALDAMLDAEVENLLMLIAMLEMRNEKVIVLATLFFVHLYSNQFY